ncbi:hypothetical protein BKA56DRAFT_711056 [Ilyonectria sp. MPI-CAGE-AT-0026]|nr:hypothetical protein BKA56DRAFT_711056 [Ilyonectria sp. MPI-CAGE-AT-0026]
MSSGVSGRWGRWFSGRCPREAHPPGRGDTLNRPRIGTSMNPCTLAGAAAAEPQDETARRDAASAAEWRQSATPIVCGDDVRILVFRSGDISRSPQTSHDRVAQTRCYTKRRSASTSSHRWDPTAGAQDTQVGSWARDLVHLPGLPGKLVWAEPSKRVRRRHAATLRHCDTIDHACMVAQEATRARAERQGPGPAELGIAADICLDRRDGGHGWWVWPWGMAGKAGQGRARQGVGETGMSSDAMGCKSKAVVTRSEARRHAGKDMLDGRRMALVSCELRDRVLPSA